VLHPNGITLYPILFQFFFQGPFFRIFTKIHSRFVRRLCALCEVPWNRISASSNRFRSMSKKGVTDDISRG